MYKHMHKEKPLQPLSVSLSLCSGQAGGGSAVCPDLPVVPRGRGVRHGQRGLLQRGAGTRRRAERGQDPLVSQGGEEVWRLRANDDSKNQSGCVCGWVNASLICIFTGV